MDAACRRALDAGLCILAFSVPLGIGLEALHAYKAVAYLEHPVRREMWTLAHAHGNFLGILLLAMAAVAERALPSARWRARSLFALILGSVALPLGFLLGGLAPTEADPSPFILLVPLGAACLLVGLVTAFLARGPRPE